MHYDTLDALYDRANLNGHFSEYIGHLSPLTAIEGRKCAGDKDVCHELWIGIRRWPRVMERNDLLAVYHFGSVNFFSRPGRTSVLIPSEVSQVGQGHVEQTVFVEVVKFPENLKDRGKAWVRAVVRLEPFDYTEFMAAQIAKLPDNFSERGPFSTDWEKPLSRFRGRIRLSTENGQGVDGMIQGAPEIVEGIAENQGPPDKLGQVADAEGGPVSGEISVVLSGEGIGIEVNPGLDFSLKGQDVVLGTNRLCPYAREVDSADHGFHSNISEVCPCGSPRE